jgi:FkbM family methyltransferase
MPQRCGPQQAGRQLFNVGMSHQARQTTFTYYPRLSNASTMYPDDSAEAARRGRGYVLDQIPTLRRPLPFLLSLCPLFLKHAVAERIRRYHLKKQVVTCELWTLADFLRDYAVARVDLLKVDAEQSERHILAGLAKEDWPKIRQVVVEVHEGAQATQALTELLHRHGFRTAVEANPSLPSLSLVYGVRPSGMGKGEQTSAHADRVSVGRAQQD